DARLTRAGLFFRLEMQDQAEEEFSLAAAIVADESPPSAENYFRLGNFWSNHKELEGALPFYDQAIQLDPDSAGPYHARYHLHLNLANLDKAFSDITDAIRLDPENHHLYGHRGDISRERGQFDKALADCNKALELAPRADSIFALRAHVYVDQRQYDLAVADYTKCVDLDPNDPTLKHNFALFLLHCPDPQYRDIARALELAQEAVNLDASGGDFWSALGQARYRNDEYQEAVKLLERSIELDYVRKARSWFFLAMVHWKLGNEDEARQYYDRAVAWMRE
ncbi:unnamed protein product, partial [marine sediment metagenome]